MSNWFIGFTMGMLTVIGYGKIYKEPQILQVNADPETVIAAYNRGKSDALRTNPVSWELDKACLTVWSESQATSPGK